MYKPELVAAVAAAGELSSRQADDVLEAFLEQVTNALSRGETVALLGFGSFHVQRQAARTGRHPKTGQPLQIAATNRVSFKPGKHLKTLVNS